jgi:hypothetical protein
MTPEWVQSNAAQLQQREDERDKQTMSFDAHAVEAIFATVCTLHAQDTKAIELEAQATLPYFKTKAIFILPPSIQEKMRTLKNAASAASARVTSLSKTLTDLVDDTEALALMNLTRLGEKPSLYRSPLSNEILVLHEENEELMEAYVAELSGLKTKLGYLMATMQNAEDSMSLKLDISRNQAWVTDMSLTIATIVIGFSAYIAGIFGKNLDNATTMMPVFGPFEIVFVGTFVIIIVGIFGTMYYLERVGIVPRRIHFEEKSQ